MAYAYNIAPGYWPDSSFPYSVDSSASGLTSIISSAASSWNNISGYPVSIFSSSAETFIRQVNVPNNGISGTTWYYPASGMHTQAYVDLNWAYLQNYTSTQRQGVMAHEFGHVINLADDNGYLLFGDPKVLMIGYDSTRHSLGIYTPQSVSKYVSGLGYVYGDVQGANYLY